MPLKSIPVSDVVAASSVIPGGFVGTLSLKSMFGPLLPFADSHGNKFLGTPCTVELRSIVPTHSFEARDSALGTFELRSFSLDRARAFLPPSPRLSCF